MSPRVSGEAALTGGGAVFHADFFDVHAGVGVLQSGFRGAGIAGAVFGQAIGDSDPAGHVAGVIGVGDHLFEMPAALLCVTRCRDAHRKLIAAVAPEKDGPVREGLPERPTDELQEMITRVVPEGVIGEFQIVCIEK